MADKVSHIFDILMRSVYVVFSDPFGFAGQITKSEELGNSFHT